MNFSFPVYTFVSVSETTGEFVINPLLAGVDVVSALGTALVSSMESITTPTVVSSVMVLMGAVCIFTKLSEVHAQHETDVAKAEAQQAQHEATVLKRECQQLRQELSVFRRLYGQVALQTRASRERAVVRNS